MERTCCYNIFPYVVLLATFSMPCLAKTSRTLETDQSALLALKANIISDPYRILARNWTNSSSVCNWIRVTCSTRHSRVTVLNLSDMNLSGTIPPQLGNLSFLVSLNLSYNLFSGTLPRELSHLHRLKFLSLLVNNFTGDVPSWVGDDLRRLRHLSLRNNSFAGSIPQSLSNLSSLQVLDFSFNSLSGNIPDELGRLRSLEWLVLQHNQLSGVIPSAIFNMSGLKRIAFRSNKLSGNLPDDMCRNLPFLQGVYFGDNQLSGRIPANLSRCSQLQILSLAYNFFSGQIPAALGELPSLQILYLGNNNLTGTIPGEIGKLQLIAFGIAKNEIRGRVPLNILKNMSSLQALLLGRNKFSGSLSKDIGNLTMLIELDLMENSLTGSLPREIGQLYQLETLRLGTNTFSGLIPPELFNISTLGFLSLTDSGVSATLPTNLCNTLPVVEHLLLSGNGFGGPIPVSISNCSNLKELALSYNHFTGFIPHFLGNPSLEYLELSSNSLRVESSSSSELSFITSLTNCTSLNTLAFAENSVEGTIPASIGNLSTSLQNFIAYNCRIRGAIPLEIGNLRNLITLALYDNELSGNIPVNLKSLDKLQALFLDSNGLGGSIMDGLCGLNRLVELSLSDNQFTGSIPNCLGNFSSLLKLDLSLNSLSGSLPLEIGSLVTATYIDLSLNQLSESIPNSIGNLQHLTDLSLAHNSLEGSIPESLGSMMSLGSLDLSYNNLSGSIPKSMEKLQGLIIFNVSFNSLSGEIPAGGPFRNFTMESFKDNEALCGIPRFNVSICHKDSDHSSKRKKVQISLFILAGIVVLTTVVALAFILLRRRKKHKKTSGSDMVLSTAPDRISYYEILQGTEQFNESNLLGLGSCGSVYKGILRDGTAIAVKVFDLESEAAFKSFDVECEVLRSIRHRNLTKVISSCSNLDFRALVLEYMPEGSLEKWLYSHNYCLDFMQRLNIMIDVASALEYLHHGYSTPIAHCDLKPSNVLLDEDMIGHVSDFGIAKLFGNGESTLITNTLATLGYIAPEYGLEGLVSTRCDMYSYGVMLMETFTRKRPSDDMFTGDLSLKNWIESSLPDSSYEVIDSNLLMNINEIQFAKTVECVTFVLVLASKCSVESPGERINMKEALAELQKIKRRFLQ